MGNGDDSFEEVQKSMASRQLARALAQGDLSSAEEALADGADPEFGGSPLRPLTTAARYGNLELMKLLIGSGADLEACDRDGWTAACHAAAAGGAKALRLLGASGASMNPASAGESQPLMIACGLLGGASYDCIEAAIAHGAKPDPGEARVDGPLHLAASSLTGHAFVRLLLEAGADASRPGHEGSSPAMSACRAGGEWSLDLLLAHGADPSARDQRRRGLAWHSVEGRSAKCLAKAVAHAGPLDLEWALEAAAAMRPDGRQEALDCQGILRAEIERRALADALPSAPRAGSMRV